MDKVRIELDRLGIAEADRKLTVLEAYRDRILDWNKHVNLTAIREPEAFAVKHYVDSLAAAGFQGFKDAVAVIDVGTGAGFPGVPLAVCYPEKRFVLVDSLAKRVRILNEVLAELSIDNAVAITGRAEDLGRDKGHRERYDMCLSRAVASLPVLAEYCIPFVRVGGWFGAYKTAHSAEEGAAAERALRVLGVSIEDITAHNVYNEIEGHNILWFKKNRPTPNQYPRKPGAPAKDPL